MIITIAFFPIFDTFLYMIDCDEDKVEKILTHVDYPDVECFAGLHILHTIFAVLAAVTFLVIVILVSLCYFECKSNPNVPTAMTHGTGNFLLVAYNTTMILAVTVMATEKYHYLICMIMLGGS